MSGERSSWGSLSRSPMLFAWKRTILVAIANAQAIRLLLLQCRHAISRYCSVKDSNASTTPSASGIRMSRRLQPAACRASRTAGRPGWRAASAVTRSVSSSEMEWPATTPGIRRSWIWARLPGVKPASPGVRDGSLPADPGPGRWRAAAPRGWRRSGRRYAGRGGAHPAWARKQAGAWGAVRRRKQGVCQTGTRLPPVRLER